MRYCGEADVDGSRRPWTEVVFHQRKLYCGPLTEVVSYATPPHFVKIKINFHEAQKLTWKEIKCLYGLIKIITPNHICELLRKHGRASEAATAILLCFSSGALHHTVQS